jgi:hypothetical protein
MSLWGGHPVDIEFGPEDEKMINSYIAKREEIRKLTGSDTPSNTPLELLGKHDLAQDVLPLEDMNRCIAQDLFMDVFHGQTVPKNVVCRMIYFPNTIPDKDEAYKCQITVGSFVCVINYSNDVSMDICVSDPDDNTQYEKHHLVYSKAFIFVVAKTLNLIINARMLKGIRPRILFGITMNGVEEKK